MRSLALLLLLAVSSIASPLVAKKTVDVSGPTAVEVLRLDTSKYKSLRVAVSLQPDRPGSPVGRARFGVYAFASIDKDSIMLFEDDGGIRTFTSFLLSTPPDTTLITVLGTGTFTVYVWAD